MEAEFTKAEKVVKIAKPGDLIEIKRKSYHWGIYVGGGDIVHFGLGSTAQDKSRVKREKLIKVAGYNLCRVNNRLDHKYTPRKTDLVLKDALQMVDQRVESSLKTHKCENLVTGLRYYKPESKQVEDPILMALVGGTIVISGAALEATLKEYREESDETEKKQEQQEV